MNSSGKPLYPQRPKKQIKQLKDENLFVRYPQATFRIGVTVALLIFFSKPLYEMFFGPAYTLTPAELRHQKRRRREVSRNLDLLMGYTDEEIDAHFKKLDEEEERERLKKQGFI